ncbi:MAG: hypothetical protein QGI78_01615 [Phycisphaerales bacterium]|nr:hypothetical protein [Phycisphaerales bacterium]
MAPLLRGDVRLISMGDSYSSPFFARLPLSGLRVWPIPSITAMSSGAAETTHTLVCVSDCSPVSVVGAEDALGYTVERETKQSSYCLPLFQMQEVFTSDSFDDNGSNLLFTFMFNNLGKTYLSTGVHGNFFAEGDALRFRFLYRCPANPQQQIENIQVYDKAELVGTANLIHGARPYWHLGETPQPNKRNAVPRHINALYEDYPSVNSADGYISMRLKQTGAMQGTDLYFEPAGSVYYHVDDSQERKKGMYFSTVADASWSYNGFGCDTEGTNPFDKRFSLEQFTHWLDVTTLDREQPLVYVWFFAPEQLSYATSFERMQAMVDQADEAANAVGIQTVEHLIIIGSNFSLSNDSELSKTYIRNQEEAAFDLAMNHQNVAAVSLFSITDEVFFNGDDGIPWLLYHGFDHFEFGTNTINLVEESDGNLFDSWGIHPSNPNAGAFFAALLGEEIRLSGCTGDLIADGYINTNDLLSVIGHFGEASVSEDINEDGIVDVQDVLLVIDGWGDCWPVQAPFNTSSYRRR